MVIILFINCCATSNQIITSHFINGGSNHEKLLRQEVDDALQHSNSSMCINGEMVLRAYFGNSVC